MGRSAIRHTQGRDVTVVVSMQMDAVAFAAAASCIWENLLFRGPSMPSSRSSARRRWISRKYSWRRRWPVYVMMLLFCLTAAAVVVLVFTDIDSPVRSVQSQQRTPIPAVIR
jgi:hypothetical protein